jgi:hypothetical protein
MLGEKLDNNNGNQPNKSWRTPRPKNRTLLLKIDPALDEAWTSHSTSSRAAHREESRAGRVGKRFQLSANFSWRVQKMRERCVPEDSTLLHSTALSVLGCEDFGAARTA